MRSELVFSASHMVRNRFMLCRLVSMSTRKFHTMNHSMHGTINDVLQRIGNSNLETMVVEPAALEVAPAPESMLILADPDV